MEISVCFRIDPGDMDNVALDTEVSWMLIFSIGFIVPVKTMHQELIYLYPNFLQDTIPINFGVH